MDSHGSFPPGPVYAAPMTVKCPGCQEEELDIARVSAGTWGVCPCRQVFRVLEGGGVEAWSYERIVAERVPLSPGMVRAIRAVLTRRAAEFILEGIEKQLAAASSGGPLVFEFYDTSGMELCLMLHEGYRAYCHNDAALGLAEFVAQHEPETALDLFDVLLHEIDRKSTR